MSRWVEVTFFIFLFFLPSIVDHDRRSLFTNQRLERERGPLTHSLTLSLFLSFSLSLSLSLPSPHCFECLSVWVRAGIFFNVIYAWQCVTLEVDFAWVNGSWEFLKTYFFNLLYGHNYNFHWCCCEDRQTHWVNECRSN